jgi:hypothetical protein
MKFNNIAVEIRQFVKFLAVLYYFFMDIKKQDKKEKNFWEEPLFYYRSRAVGLLWRNSKILWS